MWRVTCRPSSAWKAVFMSGHFGLRAQNILSFSLRIDTYTYVSDTKYMPFRVHYYPHPGQESKFIRARHQLLTNLYSSSWETEEEDTDTDRKEGEGGRRRR